MSQRIEREKRTVSIMVEMYCSRFHDIKGGLCESCESLKQYALWQTENCRFGDIKPVCSACTVHCYRRDKRQQIRDVMHYAGPRMIVRHPVIAIMRLLDKKRDEYLQSKIKNIQHQ